METNLKKMENFKLPSIMTFISGAMVGLYFFVGIYVFFSANFAHIPQNYRFVFSFFMFAYGFFRLVRLYFKMKSKRDIDDF